MEGGDKFAALGDRSGRGRGGVVPPLRDLEPLLFPEEEIPQAAFPRSPLSNEDEGTGMMASETHPASPQTLLVLFFPIPPRATMKEYKR